MKGRIQNYRSHGLAALLVQIFALLALVACAAPGTPIIRSDTGDGEGKLIPDCENISRNDKATNFITDFYLTTFGSAFREGAAAGVDEGLSEEQLVADDDLRKALSYDWLPTSQKYCKAFTGDQNEVFEIVSGLIESYGYKPIHSSDASGKLQTDYVFRAKAPIEWTCPGCEQSQVILKSTARWKDRYFVEVEPETQDFVVVKIFRDVYISRPSNGQWSQYIRATSVGHNEAVILNQIEAVLSESRRH